MIVIDKLDEIKAKSVTREDYEDTWGGDNGMEKYIMANTLMLMQHYLSLNFLSEIKGIDDGDMGLRRENNCPINSTQPYVVKNEQENAVLEYTPRFGEKIRIILSRDSVIESAKEAFQKVVIDNNKNN